MLQKYKEELKKLQDETANMSREEKLAYLKDKDVLKNVIATTPYGSKKRRVKIVKALIIVAVVLIGRAVGFW